MVHNSSALTHVDAVCAPTDNVFLSAGPVGCSDGGGETWGGIMDACAATGAIHMGGLWCCAWPCTEATQHHIPPLWMPGGVADTVLPDRSALSDDVS